VTTPGLQLRYLADVLVSNVDKKSIENERPVRLVNYTDVYYRDRITLGLDLMRATASTDQIARFRVRPGDSIITKDSETADDIAVPAYVAESEPDMVCGYHLAIIRPHSEVDGRYLAWALRSDYVRGQYAVSANGMTRYGLTRDAIQSAVVPIPGSAIQRQIADFLDDHVTRIDNIMAARQGQVALIAEQRDSFVAKVLDLECIALPLRRVVERWVDYRGATPVKTASGVPLVTAKNIRDGVISFELSEEFIAEEDYDPWMRRGLPQPGDVLLTTEAPLGQVAQVFDTEFALAQRVILIRPMQDRLDPRWLYWFLRSPQGARELWLRATGTTAPGIKAERLRDVPIPVPALPEQRDRLVHVERTETAWRDSRRLILRSLGRLEELKRSLITAAVQGDFDVSSADGSRVAV
jgi:type I restriction enzyme S subunit